jgi:hypothetical protein
MAYMPPPSCILLGRVCSAFLVVLPIIPGHLVFLPIIYSHPSLSCCASRRATPTTRLSANPWLRRTVQPGWAMAPSSPRHPPPISLLKHPVSNTPVCSRRPAWLPSPHHTLAAPWALAVRQLCSQAAADKTDIGFAGRRNDMHLSGVIYNQCLHSLLMLTS